MPDVAPPHRLLPRTLAPGERFIFIACPWTPVGGGMFKIADYLLQSGARSCHPGAATLLPLDTRGGGSALRSIPVLLTALGRLVRGRLAGNLAGVHVNMAERLSLVRKSVLIAVCRALGIPVVLHLHAAQLHHSFRTFSPLAKALVRWVFSLPASCVVLGKTSAEFVIEQLNVPADRVDIVINGVPEPKVARRDPRQRVGAAQRVLFVGNLLERKGVSDLLRALSEPQFANVPLEVTLAGGGDLQAYRTMAARLGLDGHVRFNGWTPQDDIGQLLADADVLVLPSHDEGLPLAILEALAHGVAVVCTPVGEIPHVLTDGVNACFVQPGDPGSIARGLLAVLKDRWLREQLESNGRALYEQRFSLERFSDSVARIHMRHFGVCSVALREPMVRESAF